MGGWLLDHPSDDTSFGISSVSPVHAGLDGIHSSSNSRHLSTLKCVLFNSQSLCNKFSILSYLIDNSDLDIVCITETWLRSSIPDSCFVNSKDYSVWRSDRSDKTGGGVCIITRNGTVDATSVMVCQTVGNADVCAIDIHSNNSTIRLINVYRPPRSANCAESVELMKLLVKCLINLCDTSGPVLLVGDFNLPGVDWSQPQLAHDGNNSISRFNLFILQHAFEQLVSHPTRGDNLLDLVFSNDEFIVANLMVDEPFGNSDHNMIKFSIVTPPCTKSLSDNLTVDCPRYNFNKADWPSIYQYLGNVDWMLLLGNCSSCESMSSAFYSVLHDCFDSFVPRYCNRSLSKRNKKNYPAKLKRLMRRKLAVWQKLKKQFSPDLTEKYRQLCRQVREGLLSADARFEESLVKSGNLGNFFRYAGSKFNNKSNVGALVCGDGNVIFEASQKAELLSEHFKSVFVDDDNSCKDETGSDQCNDTNSDALINVHFTPGAISKIIRKLKINSAGGPDSVPPIFFKEMLFAFVSTTILPF